MKYLDTRTTTKFWAWKRMQQRVIWSVPIRNEPSKCTRTRIQHRKPRMPLLESIRRSQCWRMWKRSECTTNWTMLISMSSGRIWAAWRCPNSRCLRLAVSACSFAVRCAAYAFVFAYTFSCISAAAVCCQRERRPSTTLMRMTFVKTSKCRLKPLLICILIVN